MREHLLFQLYGPLASWGEIAVGEQRPSRDRPTKSAILGLLAAALGIERDQEAIHCAMADAYGLGLAVFSPGELMRDYHTAQVPPQAAMKKNPARTRRAELEALFRYQSRYPKASGTILSFREYRCDARTVVAIWARRQPPFKLSELCRALEQPRFVLYLGRKSCPPALPMQPQLCTSPTLREAFESASFASWPGLSEHDGTTRGPAYFWEEDADHESGFARQAVLTVWDQTRSRKRWQYAPREESLARSGGAP